MKVNFDCELKDFDGGPMKEVVPDPTLENPYKTRLTGKIITLKNVAANALNNVQQNENISGEDKYKRGKLTERIMAAEGTIDLSVEDIALIKKQIGLFYNASIVSQCWDILEGSDGG